MEGDTEIYLTHLSNYGKNDTLVARLKFNTAFIQDSNQDGIVQLNLNTNQLDPHTSLQTDKYKGFEVRIILKECC